MEDNFKNKDKNEIEENFNDNKIKSINKCLKYYPKLNTEKTILKKHNIPKLFIKGVKFGKENTTSQNNSHRNSKMRNSVYSNSNLTETNKSNYKIKSKIFKKV